MKQINSLLQFIKKSPTSWHATQAIRERLKVEKFIELEEHDTWVLNPGGKYFVTRNDATLFAFIVPKKTPQSIQLFASHLDSPALKLKPSSEYTKENMLLLGLEPYGGLLLTSWLNRDLAIAGRVFYLDKKNKVQKALVNLENHPVTIPQLAIHLDRQVNEKGLMLNKQEHLAALMGLQNLADPKEKRLEKWLKQQVPYQKLLSADLFLYPLEQASLLGDGEMIASYRIDNLVSAHAVLENMTQVKSKQEDTLIAAIFFDHEEIGSQTAVGASSPLLAQIIERITLALQMDREGYLKLFSKSLCLSIDMAHATHPNYNDRHEPHHFIGMEKGVVIKHNSQFKYGSEANSVSKLVALSLEHHLPIQHFVTRGDIPCGSTIGPLLSTATGMATVDIGIPQLSMHSCREVVATKDYFALCSLIKLALEKPVC